MMAGTAAGQNVVAEVQGRKLVLTIDLDAPGAPSSSGKTVVIASTRGNAAIGDVIVGLNVFRKK